MTEPTEGQKAYAAAIEKMTDHALFERVRSFHPHAEQSPEAVKVMEDDYNRLKADADKAKAEGGTTSKVVGTTG
jgi:hypothetical protein